MPSAPPPDPRALDRAAELIAAASRPVVIAGRQCRNPEDGAWLGAFAEALPAPVLTTSAAQGTLPEGHPLVLGVFTGDGPDDAVAGLADLIVAFGLDPEEVSPSRWSSPALVVQLCRASRPGYPFTPLVEVVGDLAVILEELAPRLRGKTQANWDMWELDRLKKEQRALG